MDGEKTRLVIWDTAGEEKHRSLPPMYYRNSHILIYLVDPTDDNSIQNVSYWFDQSKKVGGSSPINVLVVSKTDRLDTEQKKDI